MTNEIKIDILRQQSHYIIIFGTTYFFLNYGFFITSVKDNNKKACQTCNFCATSTQLLQLVRSQCATVHCINVMSLLHNWKILNNWLKNWTADCGRCFSFQKWCMV